MNCKYKRVRTRKGIKYGYCTLLKKDVSLFNCSCEHKEYKTSNLSSNKKSGLKSPKITKLEHNRYSILTDVLTRCIECGKPKDNLHEIYFGNNRNNSMKYGCVIPLCVECHLNIHNNSELDLKYKRLCQDKFEKVYPDINFIDVFHKNYK